MKILLCYNIYEVVNMNKSKYREKQITKVLREFKEKGWELPKNRTGNIYDVVKSKQSYDRYMTKVRKQRSHEKEKIKVHEEVQEYKEKRNKEIETEIKKGLYEVYKENTGKYFAKKDEIGLNIRDIRKGSKHIHDKITNHFMDTLTEEMEYTDKDGNKKGNGAFFVNTAEEDGVEENLNEIKKLMSNDVNVLGHMSELMSYLYEKIIPQKYEEQTLNGDVIPPEYNTGHAKAPLSFFQDTSRKLLNKYKELLS